jgi:Kef-type K+ transport system membrane component KefB
MRVVVLAALVGIMSATASFHADGTASNGAGPALAAGYLLLTALLLGALFKDLHLPKLTGYLAAGIAAGHSGLDLIPEAALDELQIFSGVTTALIALKAGNELDFRAMRPLLKSIFWITLVALVGGTLVLALGVLALSGMLSFTADLTLAETAVVALVLGVVMAAQSPSVVVALRAELDADGPICRTVLGVVVIADLVVITLFAGSSTLAKVVIAGDAAGLDSTILHLVWELGGSVVVGLFVGVLIGLYLGRVRDGAPLFVLMVAFVVAEVGARIGLDPLLVALSAGMLIRNVTGQGGTLHDAIEGTLLPVYVVFFALAGARIHIDVLAVVGVPALLLVLLRGGVFIGGSRLAGRLAGAPAAVRRFVGFGMLPQAGLAIALSMLFAETFPTFGAEASALTLGIVALNEMVAPLLYRAALVRSGEAGQAIAPDVLGGAPHVR